MFTTLVGRFVGPTHPPAPMVAGALNLPVVKFITPNIIGCLSWPSFYLLPGILVGVTIDIPIRMQSSEFKWLLLATAVFLWAGSWLYRWLWCNGEAASHLSHYLSCGRLLRLVPLIPAIDVVALVVLTRHPLMLVYTDILRKVVGGQGIVLCGLPDTMLTALYQVYEAYYPQVG